MLASAQGAAIHKMERLLRNAKPGRHAATVEGITRRLVNLGISSPLFGHFIKTTKAADGRQWPVAVISPNRAKKLGFPAQSHILRLSSQSVDHREHQKRWAAFNAEDWRRVQRMIDEGEWVEDHPNQRTIWLDGDKPWQLAIKRTSADEVFLVTHYRATPRKIRKLQKVREKGK